MRSGSSKQQLAVQKQCPLCPTQPGTVGIPAFQNDLLLDDLEYGAYIVRSSLLRGAVDVALAVEDDSRQWISTIDPA